MRTLLEEQELRYLYGQFSEIEKLESSRKHKDGLKYYIPNRMQQRAHKSLAKIIIFCGGNRTGKSTFGAVELAMHITGNYPDWFPYERRFDRPIKAVVVATANSIIEKVIEPKLWAYLPTEVVKSVKRVTGQYLFRIACKNGSLIDFLSSEQDDMSFESADYDFYWGDEPQKRKKFQAIMRGLIDRGGQTVLTFTPLVEPWMKEELVDKSDGKKIEAFIVDMLDNKFDIEGNSILSQENIDLFTSTWDDDTKQTRMHGKFFHLRGQVYTMFSEVHQIDFNYTYPDPVISVLDPHDRQPHHVIWAIIDRNDDILVHNELSVACTVDELARRVKNIEKTLGYKMKKRLIDPNFGRKPLITTGRNMIQELSFSGCPGWFEADDPKDEGRLKVKDYLNYDVKIPISHTNRPKLYFHKRNCPLTIHSIRNHQYEEWVGKTGEDKDPKEKSKDKDTHGADCVRYLCMSNPTFSGMRVVDYELSESPY